MRYSEFAKLKECTTAGSVATVAGNAKSLKGSIGAGFDSQGDWGVYDFAKKKTKKEDTKEEKEKTTVIRR